MEQKRTRRVEADPGVCETTDRRQLRKEDDEAIWLNEIRQKGIYPLGSPGMPLPGIDFLRHAQAMGDGSELKKVRVPTGETDKDGKPKFRTETVLATPGQVLHSLYLQALRKPGFELEVEVRAGTYKTATFVPGHIWGQNFSRGQGLTGRVDGPHPAEVMVIGKFPGADEVSELRNFIGASGKVLVDVIQSLKIRGTSKWYVTNLLKFPPPDGSSSIKASWLNDCKPLLYQELKIVQPKYILCLGADASKTLLGDKFNVSFMEGRVEPFEYDVSYSASRRIKKTASVMTVIHPVNVARDESSLRTLERGMSRFNLLTQGIRFDKEEQGLDHRLVTDLDALADLLYEVENDPEKKDDVIAVDAEWHGEHPVNAGSYLRTIQFAWKEKHAAAVRIRGVGGKEPFADADGNDATDEAITLLCKFFLGGRYEQQGRILRFRRKRVVGHFFNADLEWLDHYGLKIEPCFKAPLYDERVSSLPKGLRKKYRRLGFDGDAMVPAWLRTKYEGGADTGLMAHAVEETAHYKLESLAMRLTTAPRYDVALHEWRERYCKEHNLKSKDLEGYGEVPDSILIPYSIFDADVTLRLYYIYQKLLDCDYEGNCCREAFWESMVAAPVVLDIHQNGICVSKERIDYHTKCFMAARTDMEQRIKDWACWPEFNIRSVLQVKEFLFGAQLNGKIGPDGRSVRIRPPGAKSLKVKPIITTSKPPKRWDEVVDQGKEREYSPSTNKSVLSILAQENPKHFEQINWIRDYRFLDQVLKSVLRPPRTDEGGEWLYEEGSTDSLLFDAGLASQICDDGRVRTHVFQTLETGRWSSSRPNLTNMCFDPETEVLTRRGWVQFPSLLPEDEVAQYHPDGSIDFVRPLSRQRFRHRGDLIRLSSEHVDLHITPNHRCPLRRRRSSKMYEFLAEDFPCGKGDYQTIHAGQFVGGHTSLSWAEVAWLVVVQAAGSYVNGFDGQGISFCFAGERKKSRLRRILTSLNASWTERLQGDGSKTFFYVGVAENRELVSVAKKTLGECKQLGSWILNLSRQSLDLLADELPLWDGEAASGANYSLAARQNADWAQILWTISARRAGVSSGSTHTGRTHYYVNKSLRGRERPTNSIVNCRSSRSPYNGYVYCVTVPSSYIVVRRNGIAIVSGNSKARDPDYKRMLGAKKNEKGKWIGGLYTYPLRSMLHASPGHVLIEADYTGAELYGMALMSGDPVMIDHATRNQLPEEHPQYYDIHSNVARLAFGLRCEPSKSGLDSIGKSHMRIVAKSVIFGIAYGRGAKAIAMAAKEQGINITVDDAQRVIDTIFTMYKGLQPFFQECGERALNDRWLCNCFGRFRRFPRVSDFETGLAGEFERQAMNFPIQSMIASAMSRALAYLHDYLERHPGMFRILLQIHDAVLLEAKPEYVEHVTQKVLPWAMRRMVEIFPTSLDGLPTGKGPYRLGLEAEVMKYWGVKITEEEWASYGWKAKHWANDGVVVHYCGG